MRVKNVLYELGLLRHKPIPPWGKKRILSLYKIINAEMKRWNKIVVDSKDNVEKRDALNHYIFYAGQIAAMDGIIERLFIEYDD